MKYTLKGPIYDKSKSTFLASANTELILTRRLFLDFSFEFLTPPHFNRGECYVARVYSEIQP